MADPRFDIQFHGKLVAGADPETVKANLMRLFKIDATKAAALMGGGGAILKRDADQATAMKFRAALKQAGALCELVPLVEDGEENIQLTAAPVPEDVPSRPASASPALATGSTTTASTSPSRASSGPTAQPSASAKTGDLQIVGTIRTGGEGFAGPFEVAPAGSDMNQIEDTREKVNPDISGLSMAPVGSDMGQLEAPPAPPPPDTSSLSLEPETP
jgi:hypothetical protein